MGFVTISLVLTLLVLVEADTNVLENSDVLLESLIEKQNVIINELLGEVKTQQLKDRQDIEKNENEILKLKEENEKLKAFINGRHSDQEAKREKGDGVPAVDSYLRSFQYNKRAFTQAPPTTPTPRKAAFSAKLSFSEHKITNYEIIKFDVVITNIGSHYSKSTGQFVAPVDGTYFFLATTFSCHNQYIETYLNRNGEYLVSMHADGDDGHETGSIGIVLELHQGDFVYVIHNGDNGNCIYGEFSNFSGFQI